MGTVNQEKQLERIADALEEINDSLKTLVDCVGYVPPMPYQEYGNSFFRIAGRIDAD